MLFPNGKNLKRNGISSRLLMYCFNLHFENFCPHFWLTIPAVLCFIPIFIVKTIYKFTTPLVEYINTLFEKATVERCNENLKLYLEYSAKLDPFERLLIHSGKFIEYFNCHNEKVRLVLKMRDLREAIYKDWRKSDPDNELMSTFQKMDATDRKSWLHWEEHNFNHKSFPEYWKDMSKSLEFKAFEPSLPMTETEWWVDAIKLSKWIVGILLVSGTLLLLYYLAIFTIWIWENYILDWNLIINLVIAFGIVGISWLIIRFIVRFKLFESKAMTNFGCFFKKIRRGIYTFFKFFWDGFKMFKADNCPKINWID